MLVSQSAWLKTSHPAALLCALLNHGPLGFGPHALGAHAGRGADYAGTCDGWGPRRQLRDDIETLPLVEVAEAVDLPPLDADAADALQRSLIGVSVGEHPLAAAAHRAGDRQQQFMPRATLSAMAMSSTWWCGD